MYTLFPLVVKTQLVPQLKKRQLAEYDQIYDRKDLLSFGSIKFKYYVERHQFGEG